jgi:hypothetical protein
VEKLGKHSSLADEELEIAVELCRKPCFIKSKCRGSKNFS